MTKPLALIVGSGPTGMAMAIELKRAGLDVRIIDKANHPAEHSQALVVQARTLEQFQRYGIAEKTVGRGRKLTKARFWSDGKEILSFSFDKIASRYPYLLFLAQSETEAILKEKMEALGAQTERGVELMAMTQREGGVEATVRNADGREEQVAARWLLGCDGAHSKVRELTGIPFEGGGVGLSFYLGDLELEGPDVPSDLISLHLHSGDVVFMGRLTDKWTRLIVASHARQGEDARRDISMEDFQKAVDDAKVRVKIRSAQWMTPFHVNDLQAKHYRKGNAFLAGDASHIHSPVGGQGMNTGIQDAANLAWKLAAVARGANEKLLDSYEEERGAVGKALLRFTERGLKFATATNPMVEGLRDTVLPLLTRSTTVQDILVGFISETAIEYRSSSIVANEVCDGALRAGDRMPDINILMEDGARGLLADWAEAEHLAVLINITATERAELEKQLERAKIVAMVSSQLDDEGRQLLCMERKVFIVRPDGYIGYRGSRSSSAGFASYVKQDGIEAAQPAERRATAR